jgi:hypothetical protein
MIGFKAIPTRLFVDRPKVMKAIDRTTLRVFGRFGAFVRRRAQTSLKAARQMRIGEMSDDELRRHRIRQRIAKEKGQPPPRRPEVISSPGEPPKLHMRPVRDNPLRRLIFFAVDARRKNVIVGPARFRDGGAEKLEFGRSGYDERPFMRPAHAAELDQLPAHWRNVKR